MPELAKIYSILEYGIWQGYEKKGYGKREHNQHNVHSSNGEFHAQRLSTRISTNNRNKPDFPPGVLIVSPGDKDEGGGLIENSVPSSPVNPPSPPLHHQNPRTCSCNHIYRFYTQTQIQPQTHHLQNKYNESLVSSRNNLNNYLDRLIYPETEVLKMEKISNFRERVSSVSHVEMPRKDIWKSLVAEFLGTFILVLVGVGCGLYINESEKLNLVGIALCWGLIIATLAQSLGHISGCHINPAVTVAMLITRKIELVKAVLYVAVQCLGAVAGVFVLKVLTPESTKGGYGVVNVHSELSSLQGFVVEFIITFILLFIVFAVSDEGRNDIQGSIPLALGLTVTAIILCAGHLTGAGLNPARVFGPAVVMNSWKNHWVWWLGEIGGAVTAAAVYEHVLRNPRPDEIEAAEIAKSNRRSDTEMKENGLTPPV